MLDAKGTDLDIANEYCFTRLDHTRGGEIVEAHGFEYVRVGVNCCAAVHRKVACRQAVVAVLVADEDRRQLLGPQADPGQVGTQQGKSQTSLDKNRDLLGTQKIGVAGAAAGEGVEGEQGTVRGHCLAMLAGGKSP